jgi:aldehyde:ferredoxin oxidoreductase
MNGFVGRLLNVDLSKKEISEKTLDGEIITNFLGGTGYCVRYLYDYIEKDTDPLSPDNILMIMTGPFCGSAIPSSAKFSICAKSPYTGIWGESNIGGFFGPQLKKVGYDGIIINGASDNPVYLEITELGAQIKDASSLWGKGILETSKILKDQSGIDLTRVLCIGQAGENLVKYAIVASEDKVAGRTGMGAVMGSKKLKAITVKGKKSKYKSADPDGLRDIIKKIRENVMASLGSQILGILGTSGAVDKLNSEGELPIKYWTLGIWDGAFKISGATSSESIYKKNYHCFACPIGCGKKAEIKEGEYKTEGEVEAPEYETVVGFGSMILNDNLESIVKANILCNDYGIDTISGSSTIALLYYLYNNGKINKENIDGLEPKWGDEKPALELIKKISFREGIGNLLAEGSDALGKKFNIPQSEIATVYGMEVPYHDLRRCYGMAIAYALGTPRGPCHCSCDMFFILMGLPFEELGIDLIDYYKDDEEMARISTLVQNYRALYNSLIMCEFCDPPPSMIAELIRTTTGLDCDVNKLKILGERIYMMKRLFNLKMGITPGDDKLPQILLKPLNEGGSAGKTPNFQKLKQAYYQYRTFDLNTGLPNQEKLKNLGLNTIIKFQK